MIVSGLHERILREIEQEMHKLAQTALAQPAGRDGFEYGRVCGIYAGLAAARQKVLDTLKDAEQQQARL